MAAGEGPQPRPMLWTGAAKIYITPEAVGPLVRAAATGLLGAICIILLQCCRATVQWDRRSRPQQPGQQTKKQKNWGGVRVNEPGPEPGCPTAAASHTCAIHPAGGPQHPAPAARTPPRPRCACSCGAGVHAEHQQEGFCFAHALNALVGRAVVTGEQLLQYVTDNASQLAPAAGR